MKIGEFVIMPIEDFVGLMHDFSNIANGKLVWPARARVISRLDSYRHGKNLNSIREEVEDQITPNKEWSF